LLLLLLQTYTISDRKFYEFPLWKTLLCTHKMMMREKKSLFEAWHIFIHTVGSSTISHFSYLCHKAISILYSRYDALCYENHLFCEKIMKFVEATDVFPFLLVAIETHILLSTIRQFFHEHRKKIIHMIWYWFQIYYIIFYYITSNII
jgi:hypothetical protein